MSDYIKKFLLYLLIGGCLLPVDSLVAEDKGRFSGRVVAEWLPNGRDMRLVESFEYVGGDGRRWFVPSGAVVNGASIPSFFWGVVGAPFSGSYRDASVIHDYYCDKRSRKYEDVHKVFYDAMIVSGIPSSKAWLMYKAVEKFGPKWAEPVVDLSCEREDKGFDFERCAQASAKPAAHWPKLDQESLRSFSEQIQAEIDPKDLAGLKRSIDEIK